MAEPLKNSFNEATVRGLAKDLERVHKSFPAAAFISECVTALPQLELTARAWHVAEAYHRHLPGKFHRQSDILLQALGPVLDRTEAFGMSVFRYLPHVFFVAKYGLDESDFSQAMAFQHAVTQRFTAEFSLRPFLLQHQQRTLDVLTGWATDPSVHVRRLVSEGTRPRLPWASHLPPFQRDPSPVINLLETLKDDPELYVRRSVANNLNDIGKDNPGILVKLCKRWLAGPKASVKPERAWIVNHALRSLIKQGDAGALAVLGFGDVTPVEIRKVRLVTAGPGRRVPLGGVMKFSCEGAASAQAKPTSMLLIDFAIHFVKAAGHTQRKVFKLTKARLSPGGMVAVSGQVSFRDMTTRKHHAGKHQLDLIVNGQTFPLASFAVDDTGGSLH